MAQDLQATFNEFQNNRAQLMNLSNQRQQLEFQVSSLDKSLEELNKTKEKKVYKAVGTILILSDVADVKKELEEQKESADLRIKTLKKQEDLLTDKLKKLKKEIEDSQKAVSKKE